MKKLINAPIKPHLLKFIKRDYKYDGVLEFDQQFCLFTHTNTNLVQDYFVNVDASMQEISIVMHNANEKKVYAIMRNLEKQFKFKMCVYAEAHFGSGTSIRSALKQFLEMYDIGELEYRLDTAYKNWQRYKEREKRKATIILWQ